MDIVQPGALFIGKTDSNVEIDSFAEIRGSHQHGPAPPSVGIRCTKRDGMTGNQPRVQVSLS